MRMKSNNKEYTSWSYLEQLSFFDENQYAIFKGWNEEEIVSFLKFLILNPNGNQYVAKKALELFIDFGILNRIKKRKILNLLIDDTNQVNDSFFQLERLRGLFLFYEPGEEEIKQLFESYTNVDDIEIRSQALYLLGLIYLLDACEAVEEDKFNCNLAASLRSFKLSYLCTENRLDSLFFLSIIEAVQGIILNERDTTKLESITQILWQYRAFSINDNSLDFKVKFYRIIYNLVNVINQNPNEWLQYKDEFKNLSLMVYELQSIQVNERLIQSSIIDRFKQKTTDKILEPYFRMNMGALETKIKCYLKSPDISSEERSVLSYVLGLKQNVTANVELEMLIANAKDRLIRLYPNISEQQMVQFFKNIDSPMDIQQATLNTIESFKEITFDVLHNKLLAALILLQSNILFKDKTENERNTYIRDLLESADFDVKDQTLRGSSSKGKTSGEIDIMVYNNMKYPLVIVEALILGSLKRDYLKKHIDKVYKYDTTGLFDNVVIVYSESRDFAVFCNRYTEYISDYDYPDYIKKMGEVESVDSGFSEIRIYKSILDRNGTQTNLHHYLVNMVSSDK